MSVFSLNAAHGHGASKTKVQLISHPTHSDCGDQEVVLTPIPEVFKQINQDAFKFASCLRIAINSNNKQWIAERTVYPFNILVNDRIKNIQNEDDFVQYYNYIIDTDIKHIARDNKRWTVSELSGGYMIGDGQIWIAAEGPTNVNPSVVKYYITKIQ